MHPRAQGRQCGVWLVDRGVWGPVAFLAYEWTAPQLNDMQWEYIFYNKLKQNSC